MNFSNDLSHLRRDINDLRKDIILKLEKLNSIEKLIRKSKAKT